MVISISERLFSKEVLEAKTPVLVHFWAPWCGVCRLVEPVLTRLQAEWQDSLKVVGFNADQSLKVANAYRLRTLPTLILFEGGKIRHRLEGFHSTDDLHRQLEAFYLNETLNSSSYSLEEPKLPIIADNNTHQLTV